MTALGSKQSVAAAEASYLAARDARKAARTKKAKPIVGRGKTYEKRLQDATLKYLKTLPHVTAWKSGAGGFFSTYTSKKTGQTSSRFFRMGKKGCADIIGWVRRDYAERIGVLYRDVSIAQFLALECKDPQGWPLTPAQKEFLESVSQAGGLAKAVTSLEEVRALLGDAAP